METPELSGGAASRVWVIAEPATLTTGPPLYGRQGISRKVIQRRFSPRRSFVAVEENATALWLREQQFQPVLPAAAAKRTQLSQDQNKSYGGHSHFAYNFRFNLLTRFSQPIY
jgi:hypothetical protein